MQTRLTTIYGEPLLIINADYIFSPQDNLLFEQMQKELETPPKSKWDKGSVWDPEVNLRFRKWQRLFKVRTYPDDYRDIVRRLTPEELAAMPSPTTE